jgi:Zn-dependent protease
MTLFGIRIRIHPTFIWLLVFALLITGGRTELLIWPLIIFAFVILHELGHSLVARSCGVHVHDIVLLPIGGVARFSHMPEDPRTETRIALAGPLVNFGIAGAVWLLHLAGLELVRKGSYTFLGMLLVVNLGLGIFNMLPAFPMDGGRLLRAWLARSRDYVQATRMAASVGRWLAGGFALYSLFTLLDPERGWNLWLLIIAAFIYVSGKQEEMAVLMRHRMGGLWNLFGFAQPGASEPSAPPPPPDEPRPSGDVIDVEGRRIDETPSQGDPADGGAAEAFRRLAEQARGRQTP